MNEEELLNKTIILDKQLKEKALSLCNKNKVCNKDCLLYSSSSNCGSIYWISELKSRFLNINSDKK